MAPVTVNAHRMRCSKDRFQGTGGRFHQNSLIVGNSLRHPKNASCLDKFPGYLHILAVGAVDVETQNIDSEFIAASHYVPLSKKTIRR